MSLTRLLFSFTGRINRQTFWLAMIALIAIEIIVLWLGGVANAGLLELGGGNKTFDATIVILLPLLLPLIWIALAVSARRLHDRNKPAWWLLVFYLLPPSIAYACSEAGVPAAIVGIANLAVLICAFIELGCLRGAAGPNCYGADPIAATG